MDLAHTRRALQALRALIPAHGYPQFTMAELFLRVVQRDPGALAESPRVEGLLYVDGDLNLTGPFNYKGLVYVEGNLTGSGDIWVLGSVIVRGRSSVSMAGGSTVLYSSEAISLAMSKYAGQFVTLSWREK